MQVVQRERLRAEGAAVSDAREEIVNDDPGGTNLFGSGGLVAIDARDLALIITVTREGICDARAPGVSKAQAAEWLRHIADLWEKEAES